MKNGIVYILTNPCLNGWVKIGMTERDTVDAQLQELNSPANIPLSYRCYATYMVDDPLIVEKRIHSIIDKVDDSLHAREVLENGKIRKREFFQLSPESAYALFADVAALRNDSDNLTIYEPSVEQAQEEEIAETKSRRSNSSFNELRIPVGSEINFLFDNNILVKVLDDINTVEYEDEKYSVSALACKLLVEKYGWKENTSVNGWSYFSKNGMALTDLRDKIEREKNADLASQN